MNKQVTPFLRLRCGLSSPQLQIIMIPPPVHRGITVLNRDLFHRTFDVTAVRIPAVAVTRCLKALDKDLLNQPKLRNVVEDGTSKETKCVLLKSEIQPEVALTTPVADLEALLPESKRFIEAEGLGMVKESVEVGYDYWTADEILRAILPEDLGEVPSSFTVTGHIAHMNLRDEFLPWKALIGQVILDKNRNITSVVNKLDVIDSTFRNFRMEVLAGDDNMITEVRESGCRFRFDFSQVYWNSRLHTEHERLVKMFAKNDIVADVFAGVGPFALPAAKKGCVVYANDLNPASYKYLQENVMLNKIKAGIHSYNLDGRDFIRRAVEDLDATVAPGPALAPAPAYRTFDHFVMNLPAIALEFLDAFRGLYRAQEPHFRQTPAPRLPMIHCHCFSKSDAPEQDIIKRANEAMGHSLDPSAYAVHHVRKVAPNKDMFCLSFRLGEAVAFGSTKRKEAAAQGIEGAPDGEGTVTAEKDEVPANKRVRVEEGSGR